MSKDMKKVSIGGAILAGIVAIGMELGIDLALSYGAAAGINYIAGGLFEVSTVPVFVGVLTVKALIAAVK